MPIAPPRSSASYSGTAKDLNQKSKKKKGLNSISRISPSLQVPESPRSGRTLHKWQHVHLGDLHRLSVHLIKDSYLSSEVSGLGRLHNIIAV